MRKARDRSQGSRKRLAHCLRACIVGIAAIDGSPRSAVRSCC